MKVYFLALLVVALVLAAWGEVDRVLARNSLSQETANDATPTVVTVKPNRTDLGEELVLPGTVQAFVEAPIYARTNGYLKTWHTDIGSVVKKGQLLAEIDAPEVDQQLAQAIADLATARANEALSNTTNARWKELLETESGVEAGRGAKAGDAAAKKATADRRRGQRVALARAGIVQAGRGTVRWRHHRAQYRHRRIDQCGSKRRLRIVQARRHSQAPYLRAGS